MLVTNETNAHAHVLFKVGYFQERLNSEDRVLFFLFFSINCYFYEHEN
jgi:uncharacterized protein YbgA (DUF1722 family)